MALMASKSTMEARSTLLTMHNLQPNCRARLVDYTIYLNPIEPPSPEPRTNHGLGFLIVSSLGLLRKSYRQPHPHVSDAEGQAQPNISEEPRITLQFSCIHHTYTITPSIALHPLSNSLIVIVITSPAQPEQVRSGKLHQLSTRRVSIWSLLFRAFRLCLLQLRGRSGATHRLDFVVQQPVHDMLAACPTRFPGTHGVTYDVKNSA